MKKISAFVLIGLMLGVFSNAHAVTIEAGDLRLGINAYLNAKYTYMTEMAMQNPSNTMIMNMDNIVSTFETDANLLVNAVKDQFRVNFNLEFQNGVFIEGQSGADNDNTEGKFNLIEIYGEYGFNEMVQVRVGEFLSPFGIFNQIRFVTPLYAPVVLPMMYQPPMNFPGHSLVPGDANAMFFGNARTESLHVDYYVYIGNGEVGATGRDSNRDKGVGTRVLLSLPGTAQAGVSYYTANDDPATEGRHQLYGTDLSIDIENINIQAEFVIDDRELVGDRMSYYGRLTYYYQNFSPFLGFDFLEDKNSILFTRGQERYSAGTGYRPSTNIILKVEYHYHKFRNANNFMGAPDDIHMGRLAAIYIF